ncbi:MAG: hypothetical protein H0S79_14635 [Anaerolineaceae bacterium]|nr:hypothetical protein [Anaerolineaceae bacterium]
MNQQFSISEDEPRPVVLGKKGLMVAKSATFKRVKNPKSSCLGNRESTKLSFEIAGPAWLLSLNRISFPKGMRSEITQKTFKTFKKPFQMMNF